MEIMNSLIKLFYFTLLTTSCVQQTGYEVNHNTAKDFDKKVTQEAFKPHIFRVPGTKQLNYNEFLAKIENLDSNYNFDVVDETEDDQINTVNRGCFSDCSNSVSTDPHAYDTTDCGLSGSIQERIAECKQVYGDMATWLSKENGGYQESDWKLVMSDTSGFSKTHLIWQDQKTKILWTSQVLPSDPVNFDPNDPGDWNWCQIVGEYTHAGSCLGQTQRPKPCESNIGEFLNIRGGLDSSDGVYWTIPSAYEVLQGVLNGSQLVLLYFVPAFTRTTYSLQRDHANLFGFDSFNMTMGTMGFLKTMPSGGLAVNCIGYVK